MESKENTSSFLGYWNGDTENWSLTPCPSNDSDVLVVIKVSPPPLPASADNYNTKKLGKKLKKVSKELRNFAISSKKWSK